jgi:chaperonin GroEL (HSP60 family)
VFDLRNMTVAQAVTSGANPVSIKRGIDKTCAHLVARLQELAVDVKGTEDIRVGTLKPNGTFNR